MKSLGILVFQNKVALNELGYIELNDLSNYSNGLYVIELETKIEKLNARILIER